MNTDLIAKIRAELDCRTAVFSALHAAKVAAGGRPSSRYQDEWENVPATFNGAAIIQSICDSFGVAPTDIGFLIVDGKPTYGN